MGERRYFLNDEDLRDYEEKTGKKVENPIIGASGKRYDTTVKEGVIVPMQPPDTPPPLKTYTAAELLAMDLKPPRFVVDKLFYAGLGILSAASKIGKSWFALDAGLSIVQGLPFMGFKTEKCKVAYFALEDSPRRVQQRLKKLIGADKPPDGLTISTESERIDNGLMEQLESHLTDEPDTGLIIIDTLQKVKPPTDSRKTAYEQDYEILSMLAKFAREHNICILLLHHTRKNNGFNSDPFESILGSTALQGATDFMIVIRKEKRTDEEAYFYATGRDIDPLDLMIKFDKATCKWVNLGDADGIEQMRLEMEYRNHPAMITLHYKLEQIEKDPDEPIKEYVTTMSGFRDDVSEHTKRVVGDNVKAFTSEVERFDAHLIRDGVKHVKPDGVKRHKGQRGRFHKYKKILFKES